jgi:hypothetical protein
MHFKTQLNHLPCNVENDRKIVTMDTSTLCSPFSTLFIESLNQSSTNNYQKAIREFTQNVKVCKILDFTH